MNAESRRKIEMGTRALEFGRAHPDTEPSTATVVAKLEQLVGRAHAQATAQRDGFINVRAATARKEELRRRMLEVPIAHLADVGSLAAREQHELDKVFRFRPGASTFMAFRAAARGMAAAAEVHAEVLAKYGLSASVLEEFGRLLDEFDAAVELGHDGRAAHLGATREIDVVAQEIVRTVRVMDGRNRQRFGQDAQLLGAWFGASRVLGVPRAAPTGGAEPAPAAQDGPTGETRPAA